MANASRLKIAIAQFGVTFGLTLPLIAVCQELETVQPFPCDVTDQKGKIVLVADIHGTDGNLIYQVHRELLQHDAAHGKFYLGLEGLYPDEELHPMVRGYDDPFTHGLAVLFMTYVEVLAGTQSSKTTESSREEFFDYIRRNKYLREAWALIPRPIEEQACEDFAKFVDKFLVKPSDSKVAAKDTIQTSNKDFMEILKEFTHVYVNMAQSTKYAKAMRTPKFVTVANDVVDGNKYDDVLEKIAGEWRNQLILDNIVKMYCSREKKDKDVVIIIGKAHVKTLAAVLNKMEGHPDVETRDPGQDFSDIAKLLASRQGLRPSLDGSPGRADCPVPSVREDQLKYITIELPNGSRATYREDRFVNGAKAERGDWVEVTNVVGTKKQTGEEFLRPGRRFRVLEVKRWSPDLGDKYGR